MEHVEGRTLSTLIPADGLPPESVIRYGTQIADALAHAHERGIVHRDLKSQNVVITPEGRAKVLDFGLAARMPQADVEAVTRTQDAIPHAGMLVGTLAYMAPEVLRGEAATARSDIWALGVLLYEMASGKPPFTGTTQTDVISAIIKEQPPTLPASVSPGLRNVIHHSLTKEAAQRYPHPSAIQAALETIQSDSAVTQPTAIPSPGRTRTWRIGAAVAALLFAAATGYWLRPPVQDTSASRVPRLTNPTQVTSGIGVESNPSWSPDGSRLAFGSGPTSPTGYDIWVTQLGGGAPVNLTADHADQDRYPSWSPDGSEIAFLSLRNDAWGLYTIPAVGGTARLLRSLPIRFRWLPQWSSDGAEIAVNISDQGRSFIEIVSVQTSETRRIHPTDLPLSALTWSPDGRFFIYSDAAQNYEVGQLWVVAASGSEPIPITDGRSKDWSPSWSSDSRRIFFVSNRGGSSMDLWQQRIDDDGAPDGIAERITTGVQMRSAFFSRDGTKLAYSRGRLYPNDNLWRTPILPDRPATWDDAEQLTFDDNGWVQGYEVSPDGERLAVSSDRTGTRNIWILPSSGGPMTQLTTDPTPDWNPRWSPDGQQIVFLRVSEWKPRHLGDAGRRRRVAAAHDASRFG